MNTLLQKVKRHERSAKVSFFDEIDFFATSQCSILNVSTGEKCVTSSFAKLVKPPSKLLSYIGALYSCTENFSVSHAVVFVSSQELISRTDSWKAPKFGTEAHHFFLFPKRC